SQVHSGKSKTLEDAGIFDEFMDNQNYDFIRRRTLKMDRNTQRDEMRKAGAAPDIMVNSAHALTEAGQIVMTSATGSQIGPIASGAGKLILVIGSQKVVPDLDMAFRRIQDYVIPYEEDRLHVAHGVAKMNRTLILEGDHTPGFFFSSRRRHTRSVSAFLLNRSSDLERFSITHAYSIVIGSK